MRWIYLAVLLLQACAHSLAIHPRDGSPRGEGVANESDQSVTINLQGKTYTGKYVYGGGAVALTNFTAFGGGSAFGSGITYMGGAGSGRIFVTAPSGSALRCVFDYSEWTSTGMGACQDNAGKEYDLLIGSKH